MAVIGHILQVSVTAEIKQNSNNQIVATTSMLGDVATHVAGPLWQVKSLMGTGVDPHLYQPTRSDMALLFKARLVLANGLMLEGKMTEALTRLGQTGDAGTRRVLLVGEHIEKAKLLAPPGVEGSTNLNGHHDPHIWMDPTLWRTVVERIRTELSELDPKNAAVYSDNAAKYITKLDALNDFAANAIGSIPKDKRILVTAHDAFHYFGRRYEIKVMGIQGISTESEAGVKDIERIVNELVTAKVQAVFVESTVSPRNIRALIEGAAAQGHKVAIGGELYSDAMGQPGTYAGTYLGMIEHNVTTITQALGGKVPQLAKD